MLLLTLDIFKLNQTHGLTAMCLLYVDYAVI
jgi:hypothetical protein